MLVKGQIRVGNVIRYKDRVPEIVTSVNNEYILTISISHTNAILYRYYEDKVEEGMCCCSRDPECPYCGGTGTATETIMGLDKYDFLANNVKEYIIERLTKNFEF